jgi:hypothetical protein
MKLRSVLQNVMVKQVPSPLEVSCSKDLKDLSSRQYKQIIVWVKILFDKFMILKTVDSESTQRC